MGSTPNAISRGAWRRAIHSSVPAPSPLTAAGPPRNAARPAPPARPRRCTNERAGQKVGRYSLCAGRRTMPPGTSMVSCCASKRVGKRQVMVRRGWAEPTRRMRSTGDSLRTHSQRTERAALELGVDADLQHTVELAPR